MKIEIGESLGYSFLRHVKQCWLVQTNWKASEHWARLQTDPVLETTFEAIKQRFDPDGSVFQGTRDANQLLKQGELDVLGLDQNGEVHAMEVAFHEAGLSDLQYNRVLKKLLRTMFILNAYLPPETTRHVYFVSPKVGREVQQRLEDVFSRLRKEYQEIDWQLLTNDRFTKEILVPTLEKGKTVADTSELFLRSAKLLELSGLLDSSNANALGHVTDREQKLREEPPIVTEATPTSAVAVRTDERNGRQIQPIVRSLMETLLERQPTLLTEADLRNLIDPDYCKDVLRLKIANLGLLRRREQGRMIFGHGRYWRKVYNGRIYVTFQWWKDYHQENAAALLQFVLGLK